MEARKVLDTNLLIEGRTGLTTIFSLIEYPKAIGKEGIEVIWPTNSDYLTSIEIMAALLESGKPIPAVDVMISAICLNRNLTLLTKDKHFGLVKKVKREFSFDSFKSG